jgi:chromosome segregation ATPase
MVCRLNFPEKKFWVDPFAKSFDYLSEKIIYLNPLLPLTKKDFEEFKLPVKDFRKLIIISMIAISLIAAAVSFFKGFITLGILLIVTSETLSMGKKYLEKYALLKKTQSVFQELRGQTSDLMRENGELKIELLKFQEENLQFESQLKELNKLLEKSEYNLIEYKKEFEDFKSSNQNLQAANDQLKIQLSLLSGITREIESAQVKLSLILVEKTKISTLLQKETRELEGVRCGIQQEVESLSKISATLKSQLDSYPNLKEIVEAIDRISGSSLVQKPLILQ